MHINGFLLVFQRIAQEIWLLKCSDVFYGNISIGLAECMSGCDIKLNVVIQESVLKKWKIIIM